MMKSNGKGVKIVNNLAPNLSNETLYGDSVRLQQVLAAFLLVSVTFIPSGGLLGVAASLKKDSIGESVQLGHVEFRITHSGGGVPQGLLNQMFVDEQEASEEGISLFICRKLVKLMNGFTGDDNGSFHSRVETEVSPSRIYICCTFGSWPNPFHLSRRPNVSQFQCDRCLDDTWSIDYGFVFGKFTGSYLYHES